jgi:uncharacterized glyoxalase superfamily protein PhnB
MKPAPGNWPRISSAVFYADPRKAIDWLCAAFGFEVRFKVEGEGGRIDHSELTFGEGLIMVGGLHRGAARRSPAQVGGNTQSMLVYVDDADAHCERARAAGARILSEPKTVDFGEGFWADRMYEAEDLEGHRWWFAQRLRG